MRPGTYLAVVGLVCVTGLAGTAAFNWTIDPYAVFHPDDPRPRPRLGAVQWLHKAHAVASAGARTLLLGNSRTVVGLDPRHSALPQPAYNLGLCGGNVYAASRYLEHAIALHAPELVLLAIDRAMFWDPNEVQPDLRESRLAVTPDGTPNPSWARSDLLAILLSAPTTVDSWRTLTGGGPGTRFVQGLNEAGTIDGSADVGEILVHNQRFIEHYRKLPMRDTRTANEQFAAFRRILSRCHERGIRLIVFTHPMHADAFDAWREPIEEYEAWMERVVDSIAAESPATQCWDFCGYNEITCDPFPPASAGRGRARNYWEVSHYRVEIGNLVLTRIFGGGDRVPAGFGHLVTRQSLEEDLQRLRAERVATASLRARRWEPTHDAERK